MHNLLFATYVNSATGTSQVKSIAIDANGLAHLAGIASQDFPTTEGAAVRTVTPPPQNYTYTYGFAALIDAAKPGPSICFDRVSPLSGGTGPTVVVECRLQRMHKSGKRG
jgi:hypothetical protein